MTDPEKDYLAALGQGLEAYFLDLVGPFCKTVEEEALARFDELCEEGVSPAVARAQMVARLAVDLDELLDELGPTIQNRAHELTEMALLLAKS